MKQKLSRILMTLAALFMVAAGAWAQVNVAPAGSQGNLWTFQMPASNVQLRVNYYALPELAWRQAQTQTPVQDPVTGYVGFESLTAFPALHNPHTLSPIRYVSTNPAAATINEEGIVTFVAPGTTTIRAVFDGDNDYQEDSVAYVLNVLAPCTLTLAQNEPNWGSVTLAGTTDSVKALENGTYHVVPGKVVTVNATATELHHVAGWKDENGNDLATATYSSYFVTNPTMMFPANSTLTFTVTGDTTATAMFGINSYEVSADVADGQSGRGMVHISYTDVQGNPHTTAAGQSATASAQGGSTSTLVATPADGYHFVCWTNGNDTLGTNATLTTNVALAATAVFDTNTYVLTVAVADGQSDRGSVAGSTTAKHFLSYEISATPNTGYHFEQWSDGNTDNPRTVTLTCDSTFTAVFDTNTYVLTVAVADGQSDRGTVAGSTTAKHFLTYEISATPSTGYHFEQWSDGNTDNPRTVTLTCDSTFTAVFDTNTYVLTVVVTDGQSDRGSVAGSTTAKHFLTYEISATPNTGYHFEQWSDGNTDNPRTVTLTCDSTFTAVFDTNTYVLTVVVADGQSDRGTVAGSTTAKHFLTYEISATPNTGYHFTQWSDGNTDNPRTVTLTCDSTFTAEFDTNTYVLTVVVADGQSDRGTVAGSTTAKHFLTYEISATPNTGYHFTQWSDGNTDNPRTVTLTCDSTFTAVFDTNTYVLTVVVADGQSDRGTVAGSTTAKHFLSYEISATPNTGYHFTQWSDGITDNPRTVTLTCDSTFTAVFDTNTYVLTVVVADGQSDRGTVAGSTTAKHFLTYEISATPNTGYHFEQWSDGNTDNPRTVTLTCDSTFTAEFEPNIYTIIYMDWETALDTVTYKYRDNIAEYIPQHGGRTFLGWLPAVPVTMPAEDLTVSAQWSCDPVTHDGHEYSAVLIGGLCWTAENLRATHYADGTEITNIYRYQSAMSPDIAGNASTYGLLYDWYDAVNAERPTKAAHVQGICPDNWRLPNEEDFAMLSSMSLHSLRSTDYWVSNNGSNTTGLDMRPAGMYNISTSRYEDLHSSAYFWSVDAAGATEAHCHEANYYCDTFLHHIRNKGNAFSVRCVRD